MKKQLLLFLFAFTAFFSAKSQNCNFTHSQVQGTTSVVFNAPMGLPPNQYSFQWFSSTLGQITMGNSITFNYNTFPITDFVTLNVYSFLDTTNVICTSSQAITYGGTNNCVLNYSPTGANSYVVSSNFINLPGYNFVWTNSSTGTTTSNTEGVLNNVSGGSVVCVSVLLNGNEVCNGCITTPIDSSVTNCNFSYNTNPSNDLSLTVFANLPNIATYTWTVNGVVQNINGPQGVINFATAGTYTVCLNTVNTNGITCSSCQEITVGNSNNCIVDADPQGFGTYNFTAPNGGPGASYLWTLGNTTYTTTENTLYWQFGNNQDSISVCVSVMDSGMVVCTACTFVMPNAPVNCSFNFYNNPNSNEVTFELMPVADGYYMLYGDGTQGFTNDSVITHVYSQPGTYNVCMAAIYPNGDTCNYCAVITVGNVNPPVTCNADFYAVPSGLTTFFINLSNNSFANSNGYFEWFFGDGTSSTEIHPFHTYQQAGNYQVCLYVINQNCVDTFCVDLNVTENIPNPIDSCSAYFLISQTTPFVVDVVNLSGGNNLNFTWTIAGQTSTGPFPSFLINSTGAYNLCLQVNGSNGCSDTYCDSIVIDANGMLGKGNQTGFTINVHSPETITNFNPLSVIKKKEDIYGVFPNPFNNFIVINNPENSRLQYSILSSDGRLLKQGVTGNKIENIETSDLSKGLYIFEVIDESGNRKINKIVKQ